MNVRPELIDEVVQGVLQALQQPGSAHHTAAAASSPPSHANASNSSSDNHSGGELVLTDLGVLTADILAERLQKQLAIRIRSSAVLTPTARDFIRERGLEVRMGETVTTKSSSSPWRIILQRPIAGLDHSQSQMNRSAELKLGNGLIENLEDARSSLARAECAGIVLTTDTPHRAACLANRAGHVRASLVRPGDDVRQIMAEMAANLFVIDDRSLSRFVLLNLINSITQHQQTAAPADWPEPSE